MSPEDSVLRVRRSIHVAALPDRVWDAFADLGRMRQWWGHVVGDPQAGTSQGQWLLDYEPRVGAPVVMEVGAGGERLRYGGPVVALEPGRELTFENDWMPSQGWLAPTYVTLRLTPALGGTHVELIHHGFERTGPGAASDHADYEAGWGMTQLGALKRLVEGGEGAN